MFRVVVLGFLLALFVSEIALAEPPVKVEIDFPHGRDAWLGVQMYKKGVIGPAAKRGSMEFPPAAMITVKNTGTEPVNNLKIDLQIDKPLFLITPENESATKENFRSTYLWEIGKLDSGVYKQLKIYVKRPAKETLKEKEVPKLLHFTGSGYLGKNTIEVKGNYALKIRDPESPMLVWLITFGGAVLFLLLLTFGKYQRLFSNFTTAEIVTMAIFISFYVAGAVFTQILKTVGFPSIAIHSIWVMYFWVLLITLLRLVPKKGTVLIFVFGHTLILDLLMWGFNPIHILTFTVGSAISLEVWFRLTGFGKTLFSVLGAGVAYFIYPICLFWFLVAPVLYHHFYHMWYIQSWLTINIITYLIAGYFGYKFANRLVKVVR